MKAVFLFILYVVCLQDTAQKPVRLAITGLSRGHIGWIFNRPDKTDSCQVWT